MAYRKALRAGVLDTLPLIVGAAPFGAIFGALAVKAGLGVPATLAAAAIGALRKPLLLAIGGGMAVFALWRAVV